MDDQTSEGRARIEQIASLRDAETTALVATLQQQTEALQEAQATIKRLNRRAQSAEAALDERQEDWNKRSTDKNRNHYYARAVEAEDQLKAQGEALETLRAILDQRCYKTDDVVASFTALAERMDNLQLTCQRAGISVGLDGAALATKERT